LQLTLKPSGSPNLAANAILVCFWWCLRVWRA
jgi:hypothetical protein